MENQTGLDFGSLHAEYRERIYTYIFRRTSDRYLADDLCAETFTKAMTAHRRDLGPKSSLSGWLYRIAHNLVIDYYRARDRQKEIDLTDTLISPAFDDALILDNQRKEKVSHAMSMLTPEQETVVRLRYLEGMSFDDIAVEMRKSPGAVKALQHRALLALRQLLAHSRDDLLAVEDF